MLLVFNDFLFFVLSFSRGHSLKQPGSPTHLSLVREAADFKLRYGRKKEAISDLEQLWKQNTKDVHTLAQLISAYSLVDQDKAKAYPCAVLIV